MADLEERIILQVDLDVSLLNESAAEAVTNIKRIKEEQKALEAAGQQATVQYRQNAQALSIYNKQLNDAAKALAINEQQTKSNTGSLGDLRQQLIAAKIAQALYSDEQKKNLPAAIALGEQIKSLSDNIKAQELALGNASRNVGNYTEAIDPLKAQVIGLRQEHRQLTTTMHGALGIFALLNLASGEGAEASKAQKAALVGLVAMQAISQIRMGALAAAQLTVKATTHAVTAATVLQTEATGALARLQTFLVAQFHLSAAAARVLSIALAATGIGLIITAILLLTSYAASAAKSTEDLAGSTDVLNKSLSENELQIARLAVEYSFLKGQITELEKELELLALDHEQAVSKIEEDAKKKLTSATGFFRTWGNYISEIVTLRHLNSTKLADIDAIEKERDKKKLEELTKHNLAKANIEQEFANKRADDKKRTDEAEAKKAEEQAKRLAEIAEKFANATAQEQERIAVLWAERKFRYAVEALEKEIAANRKKNVDLNALYGDDVDNLREAIKKKQEAFTKALGDNLKAEKKSREENYAAAAQYAQDIGRLGDAMFAYSQTINQNEIDALESKYRRGIVSEKAYNRQLAEMRRKQAIAEKARALFNIAISTAVGVINALAAMNYVGAVLMAAAGITEAIVVGARKIPDSPSFAKGGTKEFGIFGGKSHANGGTKGYFDDGTQVEVEKDELWAVVNKNSTALMNLSKWNQMGGGVPFAQGGVMKFEDGGFAARVIASQAMNRFDMQDFANSLQNLPRPVVIVSDINDMQNKVQVVENNRRV